MAFGIKEGYRENPGPVYFLDDVTSDRGIVFQPDVYTFAKMLGDAAAPMTGGLHIVDIGCGQADKLAMLHESRPWWRFTGIDYGANLATCRERYPWGTWIEHDLEQPLTVPPADIVICSDVVEHLVDPLPLLASLRKSIATVILSTPERDVQHGAAHRGPSSNLCHVREWNAQELNALLVSLGFTVLHHGLTRGSDQGWSMATQLVVCT